MVDEKLSSEVEDLLSSGGVKETEVEDDVGLSRDFFSIAHALQKRDYAIVLSCFASLKAKDIQMRVNYPALMWEIRRRFPNDFHILYRQKVVVIVRCLCHSKFLVWNDVPLKHGETFRVSMKPFEFWDKELMRIASETLKK